MSFERKESSVATVQTEIREVQQFIGGEWVDAAGGASFDDLDPFTGDVVARVPAGTR
jgi:5-carboxymethyl-2-hydroxymuconic-semialdehyde dehydrogenase